MITFNQKMIGKYMKNKIHFQIKNKLNTYPILSGLDI